MAFFKTIKESIYSPVFYSHIPQKKFGSVLKYFVLLILLLAIVQALGASKIFFGDVPRVINQVMKDAAEIYPQDLVININEGQVSINQPEPYFIPNPIGLQKDFDGITNLLVIDTVTPFNATKLIEYQTIFWLTKDSIAVKQKQGQIRLYSLSQIQQDVSITRQEVDRIFTALSPYAKFLTIFGGPILCLLFVIILFVAFMFRLVYLLIFTIITYIVGKLLKLKFTYGQSYKIGMYAITLGLIVDVLFGFLRKWIYVPQISYMVTLITAVVVIVNLVKMKRLKT